MRKTGSRLSRIALMDCVVRIEQVPATSKSASTKFGPYDRRGSDTAAATAHRSPARSSGPNTSGILCTSCGCLADRRHPRVPLPVALNPLRDDAREFGITPIMRPASREPMDGYGIGAFEHAEFAHSCSGIIRRLFQLIRRDRQPSAVAYPGGGTRRLRELCDDVSLTARAQVGIGKPRCESDRVG